MFCTKCGDEANAEAQFCAKCGQSLVTEKIEYFGITTKRLILLSFLTIGLYEIYWFYKNWQAVKSAERTPIIPFWRAVFSIFFFHGLFKRILNSAKKNGYIAKYSLGSLTAVYVIFFIAGLFWNGEFALSINSLFFLLSFLTLWPLTVVQQAINFNNSQVNPDFTPRKKFSRGEIILVTLGVALLASTLFFSVFPNLDPLKEEIKADSLE